MVSAPSEDLDQPGNPSSVISVFIVRKKPAMDLDISCWVYKPFCLFCRAVAHMIYSDQLVTSTSQSHVRALWKRHNARKFSIKSVQMYIYTIGIKLNIF